jgi:ABC-type Mn2+/Zn2+ transport system ATPase subunit
MSALGGVEVTSRMPLLVVLAGPNGAGKSTVAPYLLSNCLHHATTVAVRARPLGEAGVLATWEFQCA